MTGVFFLFRLEAIQLDIYRFYNKNKNNNKVGFFSKL